MIGFVKFEMKEYDIRLDEHMKTFSSLIEQFEWMYKYVMSEYWMNLSANYNKKIKADEFVDKEYEQTLKAYVLMVVGKKACLLNEICTFAIENREFKDYIQELLQLDLDDDLRLTGHEFYTILIGLSSEQVRAILNVVAKNESSFFYDRLLGTFEDKDEIEFVSLLNSVDITKISKVVGFLYMMQSFNAQGQILDVLNNKVDGDDCEELSYELLKLYENFILPHSQNVFETGLSLLCLLKNMVEMMKDDEEDIEKWIKLYSALYSFFLDYVKKVCSVTLKEKEWIRRIESIPVIELFDNNQNLIKPQTESQGVVCKSSVEHLPLPKYFDEDKLKRLHSVIYDYIDQDEKYFTFVFGGFGDKPNEDYKIKWNGRNWIFAYFLKILYGMDKNGEICHNVPDNCWDIAVKIFVNDKGEKMNSIKTISKGTLEKKKHEPDCMRIKEAIKNIICSDIIEANL